MLLEVFVIVTSVRVVVTWRLVLKLMHLLLGACSKLWLGERSHGHLKLISNISIRVKNIYQTYFVREVVDYTCLSFRIVDLGSSQGSCRRTFVAGDLVANLGSSS